MYCDPPYLGTDTNYQVDRWTEQDTRDLFATLVASGMRFAVSEFDNPVVLDVAKSYGLQVHVLGERQNLRNRRTEVLVRSCTQ